MTANSSRRMWCGAMWYLLLVTHILGFCYADDTIVSIEDVVIKNVDCTYFDCDNIIFENEYNSEGVGCINSNWAIKKNIEGDTRAVIDVRQCILDKCETSLGMDVNETLNTFMITKDIRSYFESGGMRISNDCSCVKKGTYVINQYCVDVDSISDQVTGRYLLIFGLYKDNNEMIRAEPLFVHLFNIDTVRWQPLRTRLLPVFTSGKLRNMFHLLLNCVEHLEGIRTRKCPKTGIVECRKLTGKFVDEILRFGIKINALDEKNKI